MIELKTKAKKIVQKGPELTDTIKRTMSALSGIVGSTLGPGGNVVLIDRPGQSPLATKDGVTVAKACGYEDAVEHTIAESAKEVCERTNRSAGDGTTTAIVLAEAITRVGLDYLKAHPHLSPQRVCRELDAKVRSVVDSLKSQAKRISSLEDLRKVAMVSANFESDVAEAVVDAIDKIGEDGTVVIEEAPQAGNTIAVEIREGFPVAKGLTSMGPVHVAFINDKASQETVFENPVIVLFDGDLMAPDLIAPIMIEANEHTPRPPVVIFAHKFSDSVLRMMAANMAAGTLQSVAIETPMTGQPQSKHLFLHDVAAFTGGTVFDATLKPITKATLSELGQCAKIKVGRYSTVLFGTADQQRVEERVEQLKTQMDHAESEFDANLIKDRISALYGGVAVVSVGGSTELEVKERKHRVEDAYNAVRSALKEGVIPGGGTALAREAAKTDNAILHASLTAPFKRVLTNAGYTDDEIHQINEDILSSPQVFDALNHQMVDPHEAGIIDPVLVTVTALSNAVSVAKMLMTTGGAIVVPRDNKAESDAAAAALAAASAQQGA